DRTQWDLTSTFSGLPSNHVTVLVAQGDTVWIGTEGGISLWDGRQMVGAVPEVPSESPFASDVVTGLAPRGDSLWVATLAGLYVGRVSSFATGLTTWGVDTAGFFLSAFGQPRMDALAQVGSSLFALSNQVVYQRDDVRDRWSAISLSIGSVVKL